MTPSGRDCRTAVPAPASRCRARPARSWPAGAGRARSSCLRPARMIDVGIAVLKQVDAGLGGEARRPGPASRAPARRPAPAASSVSRWSASSRSSAGPASAASSSRHHSSAVRPASRQCASSSLERLPAAHDATIWLQRRDRGRPAPRIDRREAADRRTGPGRGRRQRPASRGDSVVGRHGSDHAALDQHAGTVGLLGLARGAEGHQHGAVGMAQRLDHGVVAGLGDRQRGVAQQGREVGARRLDDDARAGGFGQRGLIGGRHVRSDQQPPAPVGQRRHRPGGEAARSSGAPTAPPPADTITSPCPTSPCGACAGSESAT